MDILTKLDELEVFANLTIDKIDVIRKEIENQGISKKRTKKRTLDLVARARAKRAISRLS